MFIDDDFLSIESWNQQRDILTLNGHTNIVTLEDRVCWHTREHKDIASWKRAVSIYVIIIGDGFPNTEHCSQQRDILTLAQTCRYCDPGTSTLLTHSRDFVNFVVEISSSFKHWNLQRDILTLARTYKYFHPGRSSLLTRLWSIVDIGYDLLMLVIQQRGKWTCCVVASLT